jgi:hypothetical protein
VERGNKAEIGRSWPNHGAQDAPAGRTVVAEPWEGLGLGLGRCSKGTTQETIPSKSASSSQCMGRHKGDYKGDIRDTVPSYLLALVEPVAMLGQDERARAE